MRNNIKVGDYVRTKRGQIHKITDLKKYYENGNLIIEKQLVYIDNKCSGWNYEQFNEIIIKSSSNIIDLIEVGDYVNGEEVNFADVIETWGNEKYCWTETGSISSRSIYSIVTKEQFESMEYKIEK